MFARWSYRWNLLGLALLLSAGVAAKVLVHSPGEVPPDQIVDDILQVGRIAEVASETSRELKFLAEVRTSTPSDEIDRRRAQLAQLAGAAERLARSLPTDQPHWIPVMEAAPVLDQCQYAIRDALDRSPHAQVDRRTAIAAGSLETNPDKVGMTNQSSEVLIEQANQLSGRIEDVEARVRRTVVQASRSRGTFLGYEGRDLLLAALALTVLLAGATVWDASRRLRRAPFQAVQVELKEAARSDPKTALTICHNYIGALMDMADSFCRGERI